MSINKIITQEQYLRLLEEGRVKLVTNAAPRTLPNTSVNQFLFKAGHTASSQSTEQDVESSKQAVEANAATGISEQELLTKSQEPTSKKPRVELKPITWSETASLALLAAYEVERGAPSFTKNDRSLWEKIAENLNDRTEKLFPKNIEWKNVKDKFNNIKGSLNAKKDHNRRSGNNPKDFTKAEQFLDDITEMRKKDKEASFAGEFSVNSTIALPGLPTDSTDKLLEDIEDSTAEPTRSTAQKPVTGSYRFKKKRKHGTNSKVAASKYELEQQWKEHLKMLSERAEEKRARESELEEFRSKLLKSKERKNELFQKYLLQKEQHAKRKDERYRLLHEAENKRNSILQALEHNLTAKGLTTDNFDL